MKSFKDGKGREWVLALTFGTLQRVKALTGHDLLTLDKQTEGEIPLLTRLELELPLLIDVTTAILRPDLAALELSDEEFAAGLDGATIAALHDAFWGELSDFFQSLRRTDLTKAIAKQTALVAMAVSRSEQKVDEIDVEKIGGELSGNKLGLSVFAPKD